MEAQFRPVKWCAPSIARRCLRRPKLFKLVRAGTIRVYECMLRQNGLCVHNEAFLEASVSKKRALIFSANFLGGALLPPGDGQEGSVCMCRTIGAVRARQVVPALKTGYELHQG